METNFPANINIIRPHPFQEIGGGASRFDVSDSIVDDLKKHFKTLGCKGKFPNQALPNPDKNLESGYIIIVDQKLISIIYLFEDGTDEAYNPIIPKKPPLPKPALTEDQIAQYLKGSDEVWITEAQAACIIGISTKNLHYRRKKEVGPHNQKRGGRYRYQIGAVKDFLKKWKRTDAWASAVEGTDKKGPITSAYSTYYKDTQSTLYCHKIEVNFLTDELQNWREAMQKYTRFIHHPNKQDFGDIYSTSVNLQHASEIV